jgi:uncharacterized protein YggE
MSKKIITIILGITTLVLLASCAAGTDGKSANIRTMSVSGTGKVTMVPDIAYINIGVRSEEDEVSDALSGNTAQALKISEALQKMGVEEKDIQTTNFNVYPMQQYDTDGKVTKTTYVVENTVNVTVRDLAQLGKLLDTTVKAGANNIYGISFDVNEEAKNAALDQARDLAINDAKTKAGAIATASGVTLGEIQSINVYSSGGVTAVYDSKYGMGGATEAAVAEVPVSAGTLVITFEANLSYEIK